MSIQATFSPGNHTWNVAQAADTLAMSLSSSIDDLLTSAHEREREDDWSTAEGYYAQAIGLISRKTLSVRVETLEDYAYALYRGARQAENRREFTEKMRRAIENYKEAGGAYQRLSETQEDARGFRCGAMAAYLSSWLASDSTEKRMHLNNSWKLTGQALWGFEEPGERAEYAKTFNELSRSAILRVEFEWSFQSRQKMIDEFADYGERLVAHIATLEDPLESTRAIAGIAVCYAYFAGLLIGSEEGVELERKALDLWLKAKEQNEKVSLLELAHLGREPERGDESDWLNALDCARSARDNLLQGWALDWLASRTLAKANGSDDPGEREALANRCWQYSQESIQCFARISFMNPREIWSVPPMAEADFCWTLNSLDVDSGRSQYHLERALELAPEGLRIAVDGGYPWIISFGHCIFSKTLTDLGRSREFGRDKRKKFLQQSLIHAKEQVRIVDQISPFDGVHRGVAWVLLADAEHGIAELGDDSQIRGRMLQKAIGDLATALELYVGALPFLKKNEEVGELPWLGGLHGLYGSWWKELYAITKKSGDLKKAVEAYRKGAEFFEKLGSPSRMGESYWNAALAWDTLHENQKASEDFQLASECYKSAAANIPQLNSFFSDYSSYLQAWSEIENARHYHEREEFSSAKASYRRAARLHHSSRHWSYLASNYSAWAWLEDAEDLSRRERPQEAILAFRRAATRFRDSGRSLNLAVSKSRAAPESAGETAEERQMVLNIRKATEPREAYCDARMRIEEAKLFDRKGAHDASSRSYKDAIDILRHLVESLKHEEAREIRLILALAEAWRIMARAEEETSPRQFLDASRLFEKAKELGSNERTRTLISGHIHLCRALNASSRFEDTGKTALYTAATSHLESASGYYIAADFQMAAAYCTATGLLLDAYLHTKRAKMEKDQSNKENLYRIVEKLLRESAIHYGEAEQSAKKQRVERLLEKVMDEREMALSLSQLIHAPTILSTTTAFPTPTSTHETAVGLDGFEYSNIQARVTCRQRTFDQGEKIEMNIELANAGKAPAKLVRIENAVPDLFDLVEQFSGFHAEDRSIDLNGSTLGPLNTRLVRLFVKGSRQGLFTLSPRIIYTDDRGEERKYEPEPTEIIISSIMKFLARCFEEDYMEEKLPYGEAGWRTLMDIVKAQHLSRSQVYGDPRRGSTFGKPLGSLVEEGLVEVRVFPGERGRGGRVVKVRVNYGKERARKLLKVSSISA